MAMTDEFICTQYGEDNALYLNAITPPIYMTSLHTFNKIEDHLNYSQEQGRFIYGRVSNPTVELVEKKIAALERGAMAKCFSSGMAAISAAILSAVEAGSHIICIKNVYGPTKTFIDSYLPKFGVSCTYVRGTDVVEFEEVIRPNTSLIYLESPSSVVLSLQDLAAASALAKKHGIVTAIDNTYCTPIYQKPLTLGIDMSIHTLSKYMGGHGDLIGGVLVCADEARGRRIASNERELLGGILGPMEAWLVLRGLRTLPARLRQHVESAAKVAAFLDAHPAVERVYFPGLDSHPQRALAQRQMGASTGLMSFVLKCDEEATKAFVNRLGLFRIGVSWGGFESLAVMPYYNMDAEQLAFVGAPKKLVRICIGLDDADSLIADLKAALEG